MKHRILTVILGLCMLFWVILALPGRSSSEENGENRETYAYIFFPSGKMLVSGKVESAMHGSNGFFSVTIDGNEYQTHCSNMVFVIKTESRNVLRHLNENYDNYNDVYAVGVKNTKNGAMVQMKGGLA